MYYGLADVLEVGRVAFYEATEAHYGIEGVGFVQELVPGDCRIDHLPNQRFIRQL